MCWGQALHRAPRREGKGDPACSTQNIRMLVFQPDNIAKCKDKKKAAKPMSSAWQCFSVLTKDTTRIERNWVMARACKILTL